jgi:hypothetical protein
MTADWRPVSPSPGGEGPGGGKSLLWGDPGAQKRRDQQPDR